MSLPEALSDVTVADTAKLSPAARLSSISSLIKVVRIIVNIEKWVPHRARVKLRMHLVFLALVLLTLSGLAQDATITKQPADVTITEGADIQLEVVATSEDPLSYQWYYSETPDGQALTLEGATEPKLLISRATVGNAGFYVVVINDMVESRLVQVKVNKKLLPLVITTQPTAISAKEGDRIELKVIATGEPQLRYEWRFSSNPAARPLAALAAQTNPNLVLASSKPADSGTYQVRVSDGNGQFLDSSAVAVVIAAKPATPGILADNGFRPEKHGFGFPNYVNDWKPVNLTAVEMRRLFGDRACATMNGDVCILTPPGQKWLEQQSDGMNGGHCEGLAVASILLYANKVDRAVFGGGDTYGWDVKTNVPLQREIGFWFATQATAPTYARAIKGTPVEITDFLIKNLKPDATDTYTVGVYAQPPLKGGHAVTPFAVEDMGNNIHHVLVYDNNHVGTTRRLIVDRTKNTWELGLSINPSEGEAPWTGDANSKTFDLTPSSARLTIQDCPFCEVNDGMTVEQAMLAGVPRFSELYLDGNGANLLLVDSQGRRYGYVNGALVTDIPGVSHRQTKSQNQDLLWKDDSSPVYVIPHGLAFTVKLDGTALLAPTQASVTFIGPGYDVAVEDIILDPAQIDLLEFDAEGTGVTYTSGGAETPTIELGFEASGADFAFTLKGVEIEPGSSVRVKADETTGLLTIVSSGNVEPAVYELGIGRFDADREQEFFNDEVELPSKSSATINFGKWPGDKAVLPMLLDTNRDGITDRTLELADEDQGGAGAMPVILASMDTTGIVKLSWQIAEAGYVLEQTTALGGAWTPVQANLITTANGTSSYLETPAASARFYRLRKN